MTFRPKWLSNGAAIMYCALCIKDKSARPLQAVTIFSGTALCPIHLANYAQFQFLRSEGEDYRHLVVE